MTESRKRPGSPVDDPTVAKKRAIASASGSPRGVNGTSPDPTEPGEDSNLELFRKEAIFRRMRHYAREHERSRRRIQELEAAQEQYQAGVQAIETCWSQLISEIRALVALDDIPRPSTRATSIKLPKVASEITAYEAAVQERREATQTLVSAFVAKANSDPPPEVLSLHAARREAESEAEQLRSERLLLQSQLEDANEQIDKLRDDLEAAEMRVDRIKLENARAPVALSTVLPDEPVLSEEPVVKREESVPPTLLPNGKEHSYDDDGGAERAKAEAMERTIRRQAEDIGRLKVKINALDYRAKVNELATNSKTKSSELWSALKSHPFPEAPPELEDYNVVDSDAFKKLAHELSETSTREEQLKKEKKALEETKIELENKILSVQTTCQSDYEHEIGKLLAAQEETYKSKVLRLTEDTARLRAERDAKDAELAEKRALLELKFNAIREYRSMADSRQERILALQSEVKRLKGRLAATACDEDLYNFLHITEDGDGSAYVHSLKAKLQVSEDKIKALQDSLEARTDDKAAILSEIELREQYEATRRQLDRYESRFGQDADASILALRTELEVKEKALTEVELLRRQETEALDASFSEIERLSASWEILDRQVKSKVFDLVNLERSITQLTAEKAKSDNKYFIARSDIDITNHKITALENRLQRQLQLIATLRKCEEESKQVISGNEARLKEVSLTHNNLKKQRIELDEKVRALEIRNKFAHDEMMQAFMERDGFITQLEKRDATIDSLTPKLEEAQSKVKHLERQLAQSRKTASTLANSSDVQRQLDKTMGVIKCSTCKLNFREQTLTKCGHTFCKSCLDSRISTRQRKCPACNLPFAQSEVLSIFMQ